MKSRNLLLTVLILASFMLTLAVFGFASTVQAASPFPVPSGTIGTISSISDGILTVNTGAGPFVQVRADNTTVVVKGGFTSASSLRKGDRVIIDPNFQPTRPAAPPGNPPGNPPGTRTSSDAASQGVSNPTAGQRPGSPPSSGSNSAAPSTGHPGSGTNPPANTSASNPTAGQRPGATTNTTPQQTTPSSDTPGNPNARRIRTARFIWVPQKDEILTAGSVKSTSGGKVVVSGANTFTVAVSNTADLRRIESAGGPLLAATRSHIQANKLLYIVGTAPSNSSTITAKLLLIQPQIPGTIPTSR